MIDGSEGMDRMGGSAGSATVTGFFDNRTDAEMAAERLMALGLTGQVQVTSGSRDAATTGEVGQERGFFEMLGDFFFPEDDRSTYAEGLTRGGYLVTATGLSPSLQSQAMDILEDAGAVDLNEREESWRSEGWRGTAAPLSAAGGIGGMAAGDVSQGGITTSGGMGGGLSGGGLAGSAASGTSDDLAALSSDRETETVPVVEERLRVGKRDTSHGRVRVRSYVVEEPVSETVRLDEERVEVDRRTVDRPAGAGDDLFRERTLEAEEYREEAVVQKEARVVEEVGLRRVHDSHDETVSDTVRHTEVEIDDDRDLSRSSALGSTSGRSGVTEEEAELDIGDDEDGTTRR